MEGEVDILQNELNRLRGEEAKAGELQTDFRSLRKERDAALDKLSKANSRLEELDTVTKELNVLKKEKMEHVEELKKIIKEKGEFQDRVIELREELVEKDGLYSKKDSELASMQRIKEELEAKVEKLSEESKLAVMKHEVLEKGVKEENVLAMKQL